MGTSILTTGAGSSASNGGANLPEFLVTANGEPVTALGEYVTATPEG